MNRTKIAINPLLCLVSLHLLYNFVFLSFILQNTPFSTITYRLIGDDDATSMFTINVNTGAISNLFALYSDNGRTYQVINVHYIYPPLIKPLTS